MPPENPGPGYTRTLMRDGPRLLIRSTCARCGVSQLVSEADESLERWEEGHRCGEPDPGRDGEATHSNRSERGSRS